MNFTVHILHLFCIRAIMKTLFISIFLVTYIFVYSIIASAQPNLLISQSHLEFTPKDRTKEITLINQGSSTGYYDISFTFYTQSAGLAMIKYVNDKPSSYDFTSYLKVLPKRVKLKPGESQKIKILRTKSLAANDKNIQQHTHIVIKAYTDNRISDGTEDSKVSINQTVSLPIFTSTTKLAVPEFRYFDSTLNHLYFEKPIGAEFRGKLTINTTTTETYESNLVVYPEVGTAYVELPSSFTSLLSQEISKEFVFFTQ